MTSKPVIVVTEGSDPKPLQWLAERAEVIECADNDPGFSAALARAQGLVVRTYTKVNEAFLVNTPLLKVVGRGGVGLENIDVPACRARGIEVVYTPDANTLAVGDFVFGYMLQLLRPWASFRDSVYSPHEFKHIRNTQCGRQLNELTLGILGMGRVGRRVGSIGTNGFGMRVLYNDIHDVSADVTFNAASVSLDQLLCESDVLSIHIDMRPGNENFISAARLARMKPAAILINTSRGEVLDADALASLLRAGRLAGAAIDVFAPEPPGPDLPLLGLPNVILTPHMAARTATALENMSWVVRDVLGVLNGERPAFPAPH